MKNIIEDIKALRCLSNIVTEGKLQSPTNICGKRNTSMIVSVVYVDPQLFYTCMCDFNIFTLSSLFMLNSALNDIIFM